MGHLPTRCRQSAGNSSCQIGQVLYTRKGRIGTFDLHALRDANFCVVRHDPIFCFSILKRVMTPCGSTCVPVSHANKVALRAMSSRRVESDGRYVLVLPCYTGP
jgi:hypothetical protein